LYTVEVPEADRVVPVAGRVTVVSVVSSIVSVARRIVSVSGRTFHVLSCPCRWKSLYRRKSVAFVVRISPVVKRVFFVARIVVSGARRRVSVAGELSL
jgi:hypothetical protein